MPVYPFKCEKGHEFEVEQGMNDERPTTCQEIVGGHNYDTYRQCGAPIERVWTPNAWWIKDNYDHHG